MTKTLNFDLDFTADGKIKPVSAWGRQFLSAIGGQTTRQIYQTACDLGMHIRFADTAVRGRIASICVKDGK